MNDLDLHEEIGKLREKIEAMRGACYREMKRNNQLEKQILELKDQSFSKDAYEQLYEEFLEFYAALFSIANQPDPEMWGKEFHKLATRVIDHVMG